jgi:hypothetical protein
MNDGLVYYLLPVHNLLRWVILVLLLAAIINAASGMNSNKPFTAAHKKIGLFLMIATHINLLIGLYQWLVGDWGLNLISNLGMGDVMKSPIYRFWAVEHLTGMLIATVLITIGRGVSKKNIIDRVKHRKTFWFYLIALVIILLTIPWPFREEIARPWFRGF